LVPTDNESEYQGCADVLVQIPMEFSVQPEYSLHTEISIGNSTSEKSNTSTTKQKRSLRRLWSEVHHEQMSTYPLQQQTGDGVILALMRTRDQMSVDWSLTEETTQEVLQLVLVLLLHVAALCLQFGLTYHLYVTTVDGLFAPFADGVDEQIEVINEALFHHPPKALNMDDPVQKDAQELCVKQHSMGFTHLMVLSLWGARMVTEVSETLNKVAILSLIMPPIENRAHIQEEGDGKVKMMIEHMSWSMKAVVIVLDILPKLIGTMFLMWTGGKLFMLTYTMGSLIIPLLTLTYILQIPAILFTGFSSFKFKEKVELTHYQYRMALCYTSQNCQMWGLTVIKAAATGMYVFMIYAVIFGDVTAYRNLCSRYLSIFPQGNCSLRCHLGIPSLHKGH